MRPSSLLSAVVLACAVVFFAVGASAGPRQKSLARVVSVEGATVTVEVLDGYLTTGDDLDGWTESGKKATKVIGMPNDYADARRNVAGVTLSVPAPVGTVLAPRGQLASWAAAAAAMAQNPPRTLARIVAVAGGKATLEVVAGSAVADTFDLLTPTGVTKVQLRLPPGIDLMMKGDRLAVTIEGGTPVVGAVVVDRGRFANLAAASAALPGGAPAAPPAPASLGPRPSTAGCVFSPAEVQAALGFAVEAGTGTELDFNGGKALTCTWRGPTGTHALLVNQTIMTSGTPATNTAAHKRNLAGRLELIAGDVDGAGWQVDQGDVTDVTLHYWRGNTSTEVRVTGVDQKKAAEVAAMRKKVLKLRRP